MISNKNKFLYSLIVFLICFCLCSCYSTNSNSETTTGNFKDDSSSLVVPDCTVDFYNGIWSKSLISDNLFNNGFLDLFSFTPVSYLYSYTVENIHQTMRSAVYEPSEFSAEFCEIAIFKFLKTENWNELYSVIYAYDYQDKVLFCNYNEQWYKVSNYSLLLSDIKRFNSSFSYQKFCTYASAPDETNHDVHKEYFKAFSYERFFAADTGMDTSMYSGFVNTEPLDEITKELAVELAGREASKLDSNIEYWDCFYDPYTSYWFVEYSGDSIFMDIYLNELGQTVQITTHPVDEMS